jgi:rhodanese-related sulfurtransferase
MKAAVTGLVLRGALLLSTACVCGAIANTILPTRIPWSYAWSRDTEFRAGREKVPRVSLEEARDIVDGGGQLVLDARTKAEFRKGHLPGAFSVPQAEATAALRDVGMLLTKNQPILVYCANRDCDEGLLLCLFLRERGFGKASLYLDGYRRWAEAGLPVERGSE